MPILDYPAQEATTAVPQGQRLCHDLVWPILRFRLQIKQHEGEHRGCLGTS